MTSPAHIVQKRGGGESRHAQHVDVPSPAIPLFRHVSDVCGDRSPCLAVSFTVLVTSASDSDSLTSFRYTNCRLIAIGDDVRFQNYFLDLVRCTIG